MKHTKLWLYTAIVICTLTMVACFSDTKKSAAVSTTDDASHRKITAGRFYLTASKTAVRKDKARSNAGFIL